MTPAAAKLLADQQVPLLMAICRHCFKWRWREHVGEAYLWAVKRLQGYRPELLPVERFLWQWLPLELVRARGSLDEHRRQVAFVCGTGLLDVHPDEQPADPELSPARRLERAEWYDRVRRSVLCQEGGPYLLARAEGASGVTLARESGLCESRISQLCHQAAAAVRESLER